MVEIPRSNPPHYVCAWSRNVHVCGEKCTLGERLRDNSGWVCPITGRVLPFKLFQHYTTVSKEDPKRRTGDHHIKMASGRAKRRRKSNSITESRDKLILTVKKTLLTVMSGPTREDIYTKAKTRFIRDVRARFRAAFMTRRHIPYLEGLAIIKETKRHYNRSLNRPAVIDDRTAQLIAVVIADYFVKVRGANKEINDTVNSAEIFTACIINKLATGFVLNGVTIIQQSFFFKRHAPEEIQFKDIPNIRCRAMSICARNIQGACLTKGGHVRLDFQFKLP